MGENIRSEMRTTRGQLVVPHVKSSPEKESINFPSTIRPPSIVAILPREKRTNHHPWATSYATTYNINL